MESLYFTKPISLFSDGDLGRDRWFIWPKRDEGKFLEGFLGEKVSMLLQNDI